MAGSFRQPDLVSWGIQDTEGRKPGPEALKPEPEANGRGPSPPCPGLCHSLSLTRISPPQALTLWPLHERAHSCTRLLAWVTVAGLGSAASVFFSLEGFPY